MEVKLVAHVFTYPNFGDRVQILQLNFIRFIYSSSVYITVLVTESPLSK